MFSVRRLSALAIGGAAAVSLFATPAASASSQDRSASICPGYLDPYQLNVPGYANCLIGVAGATVARAGSCTAGYTPFQPPFVTGAVPATQNYVACLT